MRGVKTYVVEVKCPYCHETIYYSSFRENPAVQEIIERYRGGKCRICGSVFGDPDVGDVEVEVRIPRPFEGVDPAPAPEASSGGEKRKSIYDMAEELADAISQRASIAEATDALEIILEAMRDTDFSPYEPVHAYGKIADLLKRHYEIWQQAYEIEKEERRW